MKYTMITFCILYSLNIFSQEINSNVNPEFDTKKVESLESFKDELTKFHGQKIIDHQNVLNCVKKSESFESVNECNVYLEKYIKKVEEKK